MGYSDSFLKAKEEKNMVKSRGMVSAELKVKIYDIAHTTFYAALSVCPINREVLF